MLNKLGRGWAAAVRFLETNGRVPYSVKAATVVVVTWSMAAAIAGTAFAMEVMLDEPDWWLLTNIVSLTIDLAGLRFGLRKLAEARERRRFVTIMIEGFTNERR